MVHQQQIWEQQVMIIQLNNCMYSAEERVEFFQSESSFESESNLSSSRYFDFTNEIIAETDNIFLTLKKELLPNEQLSQQDKVKYALSRAQILSKDTIPQHISYLNKIQAPVNAKTQVQACSQKLQKLLRDYQSLRSKTMIYKQFFNIYGREFGYSPEGSFMKGERVLCVEEEKEAVLKPECIQINYNNSRAKLKATPRMFMTANSATNDKELNNLKQEIYLLKKALEDMKKKNDMQMTSQRLMTEKRIRTYLKAFSDGDLDQITSQIEQYSFKLSCSEEENKQLKEQIEEQSKTLDMLRAENASFKEEIEMLRKRDINMEEEDVHDKSYTSDVNQKQDKKTEKKLKLLLHENQLLKTQLKSERQKLYRISSDLTDEEKKQLEKLKKQVEKKTSELQDLYSKLDQQRIQILQLTHNSKAVTKINQAVKLQNEDIKNKMKMMSKEPNFNLYPLPSVNEIEPSISASRKLEILQYEGEGMEGLPYYQILNRQFKIRFRRSCLKEKELLYKANGLEIGVISQFEKPNKIDLLLHLSNYGESSFKKVKGKLLNANENKVGTDTFQFPQISQSDQVKIPVSLLINRYPLGPLILALEFVGQKKEELRILLPAHLFKMMEFEERNEPIKNPERIVLATQRKILKTIEDFKQFTKVGRVSNGSISLSAFHRHTHTEIHLELLQSKEGIELLYRHFEGSKSITDYFIKTLVFLFKK